MTASNPQTDTADRVSAGNCPACHGTERRPAFVARDWYLDAAGGSWAYLKCFGCGTVLADPQPSDAELEAAYARSYGPYNPRPGLIERMGEPLARREAARLVTLADPSSLVVDVGCGVGAMLRRLRETGWTGPMLGVEQNPRVAADAAERLGIPIEVASADGLPDSVNGAGLIVLRHVVEHVRHPGELLRRLHKALVPGGLLYVGTPDRRAMAERVFGRHWHGYDPPRHLFAFTSDAVRMMLDTAGFELVEERWDYGPQMWAASLHHRLADSRFHRVAQPMSSLVNPLTGATCALAGLLEWAARRTTMYGATVRRLH